MISFDHIVVWISSSKHGSYQLTNFIKKKTDKRKILKKTNSFLPKGEISNIRYFPFSHNRFNLKETINVCYVVIQCEKCCFVRFTFASSSNFLEFVPA